MDLWLLRQQTTLEVAVTPFEPLLDLLAGVSDPRRGQGQKYKLPHVLLFSILAIVTGCNSYRGIVTFTDVHRRRLNATFGLTWRRAPAHTAVRYILKGLDPADVEGVFPQHAARLQAARTPPGSGSIALDGKTLRGSFDNFNDRAAAQVLSAFATDTSLVLAHVDIAEKSNEIPAAGSVAKFWRRSRVIFARVQPTSQAATLNSPEMNFAWALMSLPPMFRACPFLIIAIAS